MADKRRHLDQHLVPYFRDQRADRLTDFAVQHYNRNRLSQGAKQATINRELSTLSHMLRRMVDWKWIKSDAVPKIIKGEEPRKKIVVLTMADQQKLMQAAIGDQDPCCWLFVAFGLNTGMNVSAGGARAVIAVAASRLQDSGHALHWRDGSRQEHRREKYKEAE